jgi:hypothetical protein
MRLNAYRVFIAMVLVTMSAQAPALPIIFSNYGPGVGFDPNGGIFVSGETSTHLGSFFGLIDGAAYFDTPAGVPAILDAVEVPLSLIDGANEFVVAVMSNAAGSRADQQKGVPGSIIESWDLSGVLAFPPAASILIQSTAHPLLQAETRYWLALFAGQPNSMIGWSAPSASDIFRTSTRSPRLSGHSDWYNTAGSAAFRVFAAPIPEPSIAALLAIALVGLVARRGVASSKTGWR